MASLHSAHFAELELSADRITLAWWRSVRVVLLWRDRPASTKMATSGCGGRSRRRRNAVGWLTIGIDNSAYCVNGIGVSG